MPGPIPGPVPGPMPGPLRPSPPPRRGSIIIPPEPLNYSIQFKKGCKLCTVTCTHSCNNLVTYLLQGGYNLVLYQLLSTGLIPRHEQYYHHVTGHGVQLLHVFVWLAGMIKQVLLLSLSTD